MHAESLSTTEAHSVDLIALRAWHWSCSCDPARDHEMRKWHRDQCKWISLRLTAHHTDRQTPGVIAVIELTTEANRQELHKEMREVLAGDWETKCRLAREAIIERLRSHPPFDHLA